MICFLLYVLAVLALPHHSHLVIFIGFPIWVIYVFFLIYRHLTK